MEFWLWLAAWATNRALTLANKRNDFDIIRRIMVSSKAMIE